jgi:hypothetical protein
MIHYRDRVSVSLCVFRAPLHSCTSNNYNDDSIINITNQSSNSESMNSTKLTEKKGKTKWTNLGYLLKAKDE